MPVPVLAPRLGVTVTEIRIVEWLIDDGGRADEGAPLLVAATDKVEHEIPAPASGVVRHTAAVDDVCPVGAVIGEIA